MQAGEEFSVLTARSREEALIGVGPFEGDIFYALWRHWVVIRTVVYEFS